MDLANLSDAILQRLAELKADNHVEAKRKLEAIEEAMTPQWKKAMHARMTDLSRQASASRSKLPKLYQLMEEVGELRSPHVSCKAGCSACCRTIPVEISDLEARHIAAATGKTMANLPPGRHTVLTVSQRRVHSCWRISARSMSTVLTIAAALLPWIVMP